MVPLAAREGVQLYGPASTQRQRQGKSATCLWVSFGCGSCLAPGPWTAFLRFAVSGLQTGLGVTEGLGYGLAVVGVRLGLGGLRAPFVACM